MLGLGDVERSCRSGPKALTEGAAGGETDSHGRHTDCSDTACTTQTRKGTAMTDASESSTDTTAVTTMSERPTRLTQVAAWVGIIAGIVFIVAVIFFSGFCAGAYSTGGYWHGAYRQYHSQPGPSCTMNPGPMGSGPGMMGPGMMSPGPQTSAPAPHHP